MRLRTALAFLLVVAATVFCCPTAGAQYTVTTLPNRVLKKTYIQVADAGGSVPGVFCSPSGCINELSPFPDLTVSCPGSAGTCTLEFDVCARIAPKSGQFGDVYFHRIRIDGAVPSPGPVDLTLTIPPGDSPDQQNYCATSVGSAIPFGTHTISMTLGAQDLTGNGVHADIPNVIFKVRVHKP